MVFQDTKPQIIKMEGVKMNTILRINWILSNTPTCANILTELDAN